MKNKLPEIIVFAGPNGSGKTTITRMAKTIGTYINADDIKKSNSCTDLEATLNSDIPFRILKKNKYFHWENNHWSYLNIEIH